MELGTIFQQVKLAEKFETLNFKATQGSGCTRLENIKAAVFQNI